MPLMSTGSMALGTTFMVASSIVILYAPVSVLRYKTFPAVEPDISTACKFNLAMPFSERASVISAILLARDVEWRISIFQTEKECGLSVNVVAEKLPAMTAKM